MRDPTAWNPSHRTFMKIIRLPAAVLGGGPSLSVAELIRTAGMLRGSGGRFLIDLAA
jgi:hypothetical protein